ncbi:MAG: MarR family transcriptional regulator [Thermoflexia bacterium]|nr:MAG: MarR family transcriptional regulator [Thermoflexia bacterium]
MLEELLRILRARGTHRVVDLARALGTTPALVEMMLEELQRRGFVKPVTTCAEACTSCPLAGQCIPAQPGRAWVLAEGEDADAGSGPS